MLEASWRRHVTQLDPLLDPLATFEPTTLPVISLYRNMSPEPDQHGRDSFESFVRILRLDVSLCVDDREENVEGARALGVHRTSRRDETAAREERRCRLD